MGDVVNLDDRRPEPDEWLVTKELCRSCGKTFVGVVPLEAPLDALECPECRTMTCRVTHTLGTAGMEWNEVLQEWEPVSLTPETADWIPRLRVVPKEQPPPVT